MGFECNDVLDITLGNLLFTERLVFQILNVF